ncbi:MAG: hypothetical protein ACLUGJ_11550 [Blautia wexlerae]
MGKSIHADENFFMHRELVERAVYRNREVDSVLPSYACGIYDRENLSADHHAFGQKTFPRLIFYESNMLALITPAD